jgi:hypothetical protein
MSNHSNLLSLGTLSLAITPLLALVIAYAPMFAR